eukprot:m.168473 g.168473  ORF g.168473 m.168473 type:complete len:646 (-) comp15319_c2_seq1:3349-5286(-)
MDAQTMESNYHPAEAGNSEKHHADLLEQVQHLTAERDQAIDDLNRIKDGLIQAQSGQLGGELRDAFHNFRSFDSPVQDDDELLEENRQLSAHLEDTEEQLREARSKVERLQDMLERSQMEEDNNLEHLQEELNKAKTKISTYEENERKRVARELDAEQQMQIVQKELEDAINQKNKAEETLEHTRSEKTQYQQEHQQSRARAEDLEVIQAELRSQRDALEYELSQLKERVGGDGNKSITSDAQMDYGQCRELISQYFETDGAKIKGSQDAFSSKPTSPDGQPQDEYEGLSSAVGILIQHCRKITREGLSHQDEVDALKNAVRDLENEISGLRQEMELDRKRASKHLSERASVIAKYKAEREHLNAEIRKREDREREVNEQLSAKDALLTKQANQNRTELAELQTKYDRAKAHLNTRKADCCCANRYNGRYLGQVSIPTNRPNQDVLWKAIDKVRASAESAGNFEVSIMTVPGHKVERTGRFWPKMLHMSTESGRHSVVQPFTQILSVGQVDKFVIFVCWVRMKHEPRQRTFLVHVVEFKEVHDAEAMSKCLIAECEEVYKRKGVIDDSKASTPRSTQKTSVSTPRSSVSIIDPMRRPSSQQRPADPRRSRVSSDSTPSRSSRGSVSNQPKQRKESGVGDWLPGVS